MHRSRLVFFWINIFVQNYQLTSLEFLDSSLNTSMWPDVSLWGMSRCFGFLVPFDWSVGVHACSHEHALTHALTHMHTHKHELVCLHTRTSTSAKQANSYHSEIPSEVKTHYRADIRGPSETGKRCFSASIKTRLLQKTSLFWLPHQQGTLTHTALNVLSVHEKPIGKRFPWGLP